MKRVRLAVLAALVLVSAALLYPHGAQVDPRNVLLSALRGETGTPYRATRVHSYTFHGRSLEYTSSIDRTAAEDTPSEDQEWTPVGAVGKRRTEALLLANYTPLVEGEDRIAGRTTWVLRLKPKGKRLPWKQIWVDKSTGVVLASRDWSSGNRLKRSMKTLSISYAEPVRHSQPGSGPARREPGEKPVVDLDTVSRTLGVPVRAPGYVPRGFELMGAEARADDGLAHLVYSNGLGVISVYVRFPGRQGREQQVGHPVHDWGQGLVLSTATREAEVTVMADLPIREIERIAGSVP